MERISCESISERPISCTEMFSPLCSIWFRFPENDALRLCRVALPSIFSMRSAVFGSLTRRITW